MTCRLPAQQARPILQKEVYTTRTPPLQHNTAPNTTINTIVTTSQASIALYLQVCLTETNG